MLQLSGGQQSVVALSLVFAIQVGQRIPSVQLPCRCQCSAANGWGQAISLPLFGECFASFAVLPVDTFVTEACVWLICVSFCDCAALRPVAVLPVRRNRLGAGRGAQDLRRQCVLAVAPWRISLLPMQRRLCVSLFGCWHCTARFLLALLRCPVPCRSFCPRPRPVGPYTRSVGSCVRCEEMIATQSQKTQFITTTFSSEQVLSSLPCVLLEWPCLLLSGGVAALACFRVLLLPCSLVWLARCSHAALRPSGLFVCTVARLLTRC